MNRAYLAELTLPRLSEAHELQGYRQNWGGLGAERRPEPLADSYIVLNKFCG